MEGHIQKEKEENTSVSNTKDPQLDITSDTFDPLKALYTQDFRVTEKKPKVLYQNLAALETALNKGGIWGLNNRSKDALPDNSKQTLIKDDTTVQRRFQEYQMPVKAAVTKTKHQRNLLKQMDQAAGPLKQLYTFIMLQKKVRVMVRKEHGVRGYVVGFLQCFDRNWNLLLTEVEECYEQRKYKYAQQKIPLLTSNDADCSERLKNLGITLPAQTVKSLNRKTVQIKRYLPQILLRGEHVVLVQVAIATESQNPPE